MACLSMPHENNVCHCGYGYRMSKMGVVGACPFCTRVTVIGVNFLAGGEDVADAQPWRQFLQHSQLSVEVPDLVEVMRVAAETELHAVLQAAPPRLPLPGWRQSTIPPPRLPTGPPAADRTSFQIFKAMAFVGDDQQEPTRNKFFRRSRRPC